MPRCSAKLVRQDPSARRRTSIMQRIMCATDMPHEQP